MANLALVPNGMSGSGAQARAPVHEALSNRLLLGIDEPTRALLKAELVTLRRGQTLYEVDAPIQHVYFVNRGIVSLVKTMRDGRTVEIGAVGNEGVAGVSALFDVDTSIFETMMQVPGTAWRASVENVRRVMAASKAFHDLVEGYVHVAMAQIAQTAACNRLHSLEERCCRWFLICHDAAGANEFQLTHEFLAMMLGVRRVSVSIAAAGLQQQGFIKYRRGRVHITSRPGLESHACECYSTVRAQTERLFAGRLHV